MPALVRRSGKSFTTIDMTGPFFTRDPRKTFRANIRVLMKAIAEEGEADVKAQIGPHNRTGKTQAGVVGRVTALTGKTWAVTAVVSQTRVFPWKVHRNSRAQAIYRGGRLEAKVHMFRRTTGRLRRARAINRVELTRGM